MQPVRIVVAEDDYLARSGLVALISSVPGMQVVGDGGSATALYALVDSTRPDVVLTDIRMPPTRTDEGIRAAAALRRTHPNLGVVVISHFVEAEYALDLVASGSQGRGYLLKEHLADIDQLTAAIRTVAAGGSSIDPAVVTALMNARRGSDPLATLTAREREVLAAVARGGSNAAIAAELFVTERAVEKHINAIFAKLGLTADSDVNRRVAAVLIYLGGRPFSGGGSTIAARRRT